MDLTFIITSSIYTVQTAFPPITRLNAPIALLGVEPLHCSASHHTSSKRSPPPSSTGQRIKISARNRKQVRRSSELGNADEPREIDPSDIRCFYRHCKITA